MNRPSFFRLIAFSGSAGYNFQTSPYSRHSLTVFKLTYNKLLHTTEAFDKTMDENPAIAMSFRNQFVPSINYTYTFDKTYGSTGNRRFYWQNSVTSAGNLLSGILSLFGEANVEYRFGIMGRLNGAVVLDAGNIWLLKKDPKRPGAELKWKGLLNEIALGTGFGLRYDISYLVIRADLGIGIHTPYPNPDKTGYYNISSFKDGLGFHLAIGYPF